MSSDEIREFVLGLTPQQAQRVQWLVDRLREARARVEFLSKALAVLESKLD